MPCFAWGSFWWIFPLAALAMFVIGFILMRVCCVRLCRGSPPWCCSRRAAGGPESREGGA